MLIRKGTVTESGVNPEFTRSGGVVSCYASLGERANGRLDNAKKTVNETKPFVYSSEPDRGSTLGLQNTILSEGREASRQWASETVSSRGELWSPKVGHIASASVPTTFAPSRRVPVDRIARLP